MDGLSRIGGPSRTSAPATSGAAAPARTDPTGRRAPAAAGDTPSAAVVVTFSGAPPGPGAPGTPSVSASEILRSVRTRLGLPDAAEIPQWSDEGPARVAEAVAAALGALFPRFRASNPGPDDGEALDRFFSAVRRGVDRGASAASEAIDRLGEAAGQARSAATETERLIRERIDALEKTTREAYGRGAAAGGAPPAAEAPSVDTPTLQEKSFTA